MKHSIEGCTKNQRITQTINRDGKTRTGERDNRQYISPRPGVAFIVNKLESIEITYLFTTH